MIIVDRILNDLAICINDGVQIDIPISKIEGKVSEGDLLYFDESDIKYSKQVDEPQKCKDGLSERFNRIKTRNKI